MRGVWNADDLLVSFGVRGNGFTLASGDALLDNFQVRSGRVVPVPVPEPATALLLLSAVLAGILLRRR